MVTIKDKNRVEKGVKLGAVHEGCYMVWGALPAAALLSLPTFLPPSSPGDLPDASRRDHIEEPYVRLEMVTPVEYVGPLMDLATNRRGTSTCWAVLYDITVSHYLSC